MRIKTPSPSYLKGTNGHAILLLHSFTGTNRDVKHLAAELNDQDLVVMHRIIQVMAYC